MNARNRLRFGYAVALALWLAVTIYASYVLAL